MLRLIAIGAVSALTIASAMAQDASSWPDKAIKLIVPFQAGSGTDVPARILADHLGRELGQPVVVENRPGASGTIGTTAVAQADADGYTFGIGTATTHTVVPTMETGTSYDPVEDFVPVAILGVTPYVFVVYPGLGFENVDDLISAAAAEPGRMNYGSAGIGSLAHLAAADFAARSEIDLVHIPYQASAESVTDLISGRLDMQFATLAPMLPNIRAGQVQALAISSAERSPALPDVPTVAESGIEGYEAGLWMAIFGPSGTDPEVVAKFNEAVNTVIEGAAREALLEQGLQLTAQTPEQVGELVSSDLVRWASVIETLED